MNKESKIFVAGHHGLVGSAILHNLQNKGYNNFILRSHRELDLTNQAAVTEFFEQEKPEYVFLAAAKVGGIMANSLYRADFIYQNLMIENNVIYNAWKQGVKKLLFLGSTCIYPRDAEQPMPEDCLLSAPLEYTNEPYAISKIAGIKLCESFNLQYGTNYIAVMPTNLYGPNDNFNLETSHVLPAMLRKLCLGKCLETGNEAALREDLNRRPVEGVSGKSDAQAILAVLKKYGISGSSSNLSEPSKVVVELWGTGTPLREFLWSEEMADACVFLMENINFSDIMDRQFPVNVSDHDTVAGRSPLFPRGEVRNTHINIGTGKELTIKEVAGLIKKVVGFNGEIYFNSSKPDGTMRKLTDVSKLHQLGWHHQIDIEEGVNRLFKWYIEN